MTTDTAAIREEERFDEARVARYLREALPDLIGSEVEFEQFHGGHANLTYLARSGDIEVVLRRPPLGDVAPGAHDMRRESRVLAVLHEAFPPAPRAYHYCDDPQVMGKPFFVMERRRGTVIRGHWPPELPTRLQSTVAERFIASLAALHLVDFEALGLSDLGKPEGFVRRQVEGWTDRWHRARHDEIPDMDRLASGLADRIPEPSRTSLLHNDFKLDNTMVDSAGDITAVLDWDMATTGDPLVDVGTTLSYFEGPEEVAVVVPADRQVLGGAMEADELVDRYAVATGLDCAGISWYRALGSFRIAVILQQIYIRYVRGQTTDERFAALGHAVGPLAAEGLRHLGSE